MFGISDKEIEPINQLAKELDPMQDLNKMGAWGLLHLVCGALAGQRLKWSSRVVEYLSDEYEIISNFLSQKTNDEEIAMNFSNFIKEWSENEQSNIQARAEINSLSREKNIKISEETYDYYCSYLTLAFMLNGLYNLATNDRFDEVKN